jgi:hypothetical protein
MGSIYTPFRPERYTIKKYLGKGKYGGHIFEVYTGHTNDWDSIGETSEIMALLTEDEYEKLKENEQLKTKLKDWKYETQCHIDEVIAREKEIERLRIQIASMKKALNLILGYSKNGCIYFIEEIAKEALSEDVTEKYHNPADITLLRKAKDCLKQGIKQLEKYINRFEQTPEEDACIEMHETVLEIDKILGGNG